MSGNGGLSNMEYVLVEKECLPKELQELFSSEKTFSLDELLKMHMSCLIEIAKGNTHLNAKLYHATRDEVKHLIRIKEMEAKK